MDYQKAISKAVKDSKNNETRFVINIDHYEDRTFVVCKEVYLYTDEFYAFDGYVVDEYFDGKRV